MRFWKDSATARAFSSHRSWYAVTNSQVCKAERISETRSIGSEVASDSSEAQAQQQSDIERKIARVSEQANKDRTGAGARKRVVGTASYLQVSGHRSTHVRDSSSGIRPARLLAENDNEGHFSMQPTSNVNPPKKED
ncbi:hypothetical protein PCS70012_02304 [Streptococcus pneumoniae PCS70012]|nr:hypothetical protein PCS70012_02304 [Streptococcus pneumoniae PCS70012]